MGAESGANKIVFFYFDFLLNFDCLLRMKLRVEGRQLLRLTFVEASV